MEVMISQPMNGKSNEQIKRMTSEEKEQLETIKKFNDLFGGLI